MLQIEIRIKGYIQEQWSEWFGSLALSHPNPNETILSGVLSDEAALYGIIARLRDLGLHIISLSSEEVDEEPLEE